MPHIIQLILHHEIVQIFCSVESAGYKDFQAVAELVKTVTTGYYMLLKVTKIKSFTGGAPSKNTLLFWDLGVLFTIFSDRGEKCKT